MLVEVDDTLRHCEVIRIGHFVQQTKYETQNLQLCQYTLRALSTWAGDWLNAHFIPETPFLNNVHAYVQHILHELLALA